MPETIEIGGNKIPVATEAELLDFANAIRRAGGAGVLDALLPSTKGDPENCLIANAPNFGCMVAPIGTPEVRSAGLNGYYFPSGALRWSMVLPKNLTDEQREALNTVEGVRVLEAQYAGEPLHYFIPLPETIGNAAAAFDAGKAFQNFDRRNEA